MIARPRTVTWMPQNGYLLCTVEQDEFTVSLALSDLSKALDERGAADAMQSIEDQCVALLERQIKEANDRP